MAGFADDAPETVVKYNRHFGVLPKPDPELAKMLRDARDEVPSVKRGGHPEFYRILEGLGDLYSTKHYQYATDDDPMSNFRLCGNIIHKLLKPGVDPTLAACLALVSKQIIGVYEIVGEGKKNTVDSLQDKLRDIAIYSIIAQILIEEAK